MADDELTGSTHVDEGTLHAWLDDALSADQSRTVELHIATCESCSMAAAEARGLIAASTRILSTLDEVPGNVIPTAGRENAPSTTLVRSRSFVLRFGPTAAVAVFAIGAGLVMSSRHGTEPLASTLQRASTESMSVARAGGKATTEKGTRQTPPAHPANEERATAASAGVSTTVPEPVQPATVKSPDAKASGMAEPALSGDMAQAMTEASAAHSKIAVAPVLPPHGVAAGTGRLDAPLRTIALAPSAVAADANKRLAPAVDSSSPTMTGATVVSTTQSIENVSHVRSTVFRLESGVTVILTERRSLTPEEAATVRTDTATNPPSIVLRAPSFQESPSVMWIGRDGASLTLSGALSVKDLQALKQRIVE